MSTVITTGGVDSPQQLSPQPMMNRSGLHRSQGEVKGAGLPSSQEVRASQLRGESIPISDQQLVNAIERAIKAVQGPTTSLDFSVHKTTKQIMVKVMDSETGEVIREFPPEKNLDLLAKLWEMAGILVDEKR